MADTTTPQAAQPAPSAGLSTAEHQAIRAIQRKLDKWELDHLREHATQLAARVDQLQEDLDAARDRADDAERRAEWWHEQVMEMQKDLADDVVVALSMDGSLSLVKRQASALAEGGLDLAQDGGEVVDRNAHVLTDDGLHSSVGRVGGGEVVGQGLASHGGAQCVGSLVQSRLEAVDGLGAGVRHDALRWLDVAEQRIRSASEACRRLGDAATDTQLSEARIAVDLVASPLNEALLILDRAP